ncbi:hypothetical protein [Bacillus sp. PK3_68]|uniref:hypothetical protein n=1 Tax=Bacillus sp. PK3_68 TaxID=2027408 RepID=UPI000E75E6EB|nr:hypothetical protein [Bacillus sp. PK3_68]RJS60104.1 hypothetical protein CJ483_08545 [Bacillus sp. PK3_68]
MRIHKYSGGLVFDEKFDAIGPEWSTSDPANIKIENNALKLTHSSLRDVFILRDIPASAGAFEADITYNPTAINDRGGLLLFNATNETAELLESEDAALSALENIKVIRNNDTFNFYMQRNGLFELIDSVSYPFSKIGFVLKQGDAAEFVPLYVERFIATKSNCLQVKNLMSGYKVELISGMDIITGMSDVSGVVELTLPHLIMTGTLRIYDETNKLIDEKTADFAGGDIYYCGTFLEIRKEGTPLNEANPNGLGRMENGVLEVKLDVYNPTSIIANNIQLAVQQYSGQFGYEWADIAADIEGVPGIYQDTLHIPSIEGNSMVSFWIKVEKVDTSIDSDSVSFAISMEHATG